MGTYHRTRNPARHGYLRHLWLRVAVAALVLGMVLLGSPSVVRAAWTLSAGAVHCETSPRRLAVDFTISPATDLDGLKVWLYEGASYVDDKPASSSEWFFILPHPGAYTLKLIRTSSGEVLSTANVTASRTPNVVVKSPVHGDEGAALTIDASGSSDPDTPWGDILTYNWSWGEGALVPDSGFSTSPTATHTFLDSGGYTVTLTVKDRAGLTVTRYISAIVQNLPPAAAFSAPATVASGASFTLQLWAPQDPGFFDRDSLQYAFDCGDGSGYGAWANWGPIGTSPSHTQSCTMTSACGASRTVKGKIKDKDGGVSEYTSVVSVPDSPPTFNPIAKKGGVSPYTASAWSNQSVTVTWNVADDCGINVWPPGYTTVSAEGTRPLVSATATDSGGHTVTATFGPIKIDRTPPVITTSAKTADDNPYTAGTWTTQPVTVHFACTDSLSGVDSCPADVLVSDEGSTTVERGATDKAGNSATASFGPIMISSGPIVTASATNEDGSAYSADTWTNQTVTVHFECSDGSGVASCPSDVAVSAEGVTDSVSGTATDNVGESTTATLPAAL